MEKDHMEILLEHIDSKLELVTEGYSLLSDRIDQLDRKIDQVSADAKFHIKIITTKFNDQNVKQKGRFEQLQEHLSNQDIKLQRITDDLAAHRADTEAHVS